MLLWRRWVASHGEAFESLIAQKNAANPAWSFLSETRSAGALFYRDRLTFERTLRQQDASRAASLLSPREEALVERLRSWSPARRRSSVDAAASSGRASPETKRHRGGRGGPQPNGWQSSLRSAPPRSGRKQTWKSTTETSYSFAGGGGSSSTPRSRSTPRATSSLKERIRMEDERRRIEQARSPAPRTRPSQPTTPLSSLCVRQRKPSDLSCSDGCRKRHGEEAALAIAIVITAADLAGPAAEPHPATPSPRAVGAGDARRLGTEHDARPAAAADAHPLRCRLPLPPVPEPGAAAAIHLRGAGFAQPRPLTTLALP